MNLSDYKVSHDVWQAMTDVTRHKDDTALMDILSTQPDALSPMAGRFMADLYRFKAGKGEAPMLEGIPANTKAFIAKDTFTRHREIMQWIAFYRGMGYPAKGSFNVYLHACLLVTCHPEYDITDQTVLSDIWKGRNKKGRNKESLLGDAVFLHFWLKISFQEGQAALALNNGELPYDHHGATELRERFFELPESEYSDLMAQVQDSDRWDRFREKVLKPPKPRKA